MVIYFAAKHHVETPKVRRGEYFRLILHFPQLCHLYFEMNANEYMYLWLFGRCDADWCSNWLYGGPGDIECTVYLWLHCQSEINISVWHSSPLCIHTWICKQKSRTIGASLHTKQISSFPIPQTKTNLSHPTDCTVWTKKQTRIVYQMLLCWAKTLIPSIFPLDLAREAGLLSSK